MFEPFAEVPLYPLVFPVFWGAAVFFTLAMARHLRVFAAARNASPTDRPMTRLWGTVRYGLVQTRMFRDLPAGIMHFGIFWGFVLLTIGTANMDNRSFRLNFEVTAVIYGADHADELAQQFRRDLQSSKEIKKQTRDRLSLGWRVAEAGARVLSPLL